MALGGAGSACLDTASAIHGPSGGVSDMGVDSECGPWSAASCPTACCECERNDGYS